MQTQSGRECRVTMEAETGAARLQPKAHQGLLAAARGQERDTGQSSSEPPEGTSPSHTLIPDF